MEPKRSGIAAVLLKLEQRESHQPFKIRAAILRGSHDGVARISLYLAIKADFGNDNSDPPTFQRSEVCGQPWGRRSI